MDVRSVWLSLVRFPAVLLSALVMLFCMGLADAQAQGVEASGSTSEENLKLAQYYYFPNYPYPQVRPKKRRPPRRVTRRCAHPWTYSRGLRRCICVREGHSVSNGKCIKTAEICQKNALWSDTEKKCVCQDGFVENGGQCTDPNAGVVTYNPAGEAQCLWPRVKPDDGSGCACAHGYREEAGQCIRDDNPAQAKRRRARPNELLTDSIPLVQKCLAEAGYLRSSVQDSMGRKAWTAYWFFKQDYSVGRTPKGVHDAKAQHKLFALCPKVASELAALPAGARQQAMKASPENPKPDASSPALSPNRQQASLTPPAATEVKPAPEVKAPARRVYAKPEAGCLPGDLHKLIIDTYGARPKLKRCTQSCIARPSNITKREIEAFENKRGVRWCRSCIEIGSQLPLEDILRIERGANVQVCTRAPSRLPKWAPRTVSKRPGYTKVRTLYRQFPRSVENEKAIAVIIGNGTYGKGLPANASAQANAGAMYTFLTEHLGYQQENIFDLRDLTSKDVTRVFGSAEEPHGELWQRIQDKAADRVFVYYSGHAGTLPDGSDSYLLPVDTIKYREEHSGYLMSQLYANLQKLEVKSAMVFLEADFGRDMSDYVFPPNLPEMQVNALPEKPLPGINVITASDGDQKTLDDPEYGIGLFTRYLIEGLAGRADLAPIGNGDRKIDAVELYAYTSHMVRLSARKSFGLLQKPMMSRSGNLQVSRVQVQGQ